VSLADLLQKVLGTHKDIPVALFRGFRWGSIFLGRKKMVTVQSEFYETMMTTQLFGVGA
jgi:hypothetical protein